MGDKSIKKETKKKKKTDTVSASSKLKPVVPQPELVRKPKKEI
jgi:hypothetical protein